MKLQLAKVVQIPVFFPHPLASFVVLVTRDFPWILAIRIFFSLSRWDGHWILHPFQKLEQSEFHSEISQSMSRLWLRIYSKSFSMPGNYSRGGSPIIESSQILMCFPFPGIQVRLGEKKLSAFIKIEKIVKPFLTREGLSRHLKRFPEKYFLQREALHQVTFPKMIFHIILAPRAKF